MTLEEIDSYLLTGGKEISSPFYSKFIHKAKVSLNAPMIHVGGSNGKGETCFYLTSLAMAASKKVGTFFNFYFHHFNEAIWINGKPLNIDTAVAYFNELYPLAMKFEVTSFELLTTIAYKAFNEANLDLAIVECGMGGTYDPTNIDGLEKLATVITNVSLEHTEYLGTTPSEIAYSIAGIITDKIPVIAGPMDETSEEALKTVAAKKHTVIYRTERVHLPHLVNNEGFAFDYPPFKGIVVPGLANYHVANLCLALETFKHLNFPQLSEEQINSSLKNAGILEGRLEKSGDIFFDCASNPASIEALCRCFPTIGKGKPIHVLFASFYRQNISSMLPPLDDISQSVTLTSFDEEGARNEDGYALYVQDHTYFASPLMALITLQTTYPEEPIVITGCPEFVRYMKGRV